MAGPRCCARQRGRAVRADWRLEESEAPTRRAWAQEIDGTPFAKVLRERRVEARIEPAGEGTRVTLELRQRGRADGALRPLHAAAGGAKELDGALDGLARAVR